eukprot:2041091-Amphidinium_carterae.1
MCYPENSSNYPKCGIPCPDASNAPKLEGIEGLEGHKAPHFDVRVWHHRYGGADARRVPSRSSGRHRPKGKVTTMHRIESYCDIMPA